MSNEGAVHNTQSLQIALGDKVKVKVKDKKNKKKALHIGTVCFFGAVDDHKGSWFGICFDEPVGKNDGIYKHRKYFECLPGCGLFVQSDHIVQIVSRSRAKHTNHNNDNDNDNGNHNEQSAATRLHVDAHITIPKYGDGITRFAGLAAFDPGIWYGIELRSTPHDTYSTTPMSEPHTGDGCVSGITYFQCKAGHGIFCREHDLYTSTQSPHNKIDMLAMSPFVKENSSNSNSAPSDDEMKDGGLTLAMQMLGSSQISSDEEFEHTLDMSNNINNNASTMTVIMTPTKPFTIAESGTSDDILMSGATVDTPDELPDDDDHNNDDNNDKNNQNSDEIEIAPMIRIQLERASTNDLQQRPLGTVDTPVALGELSLSYDSVDFDAKPTSEMAKPPTPDMKISKSAPAPWSPPIRQPTHPSPINVTPSSHSANNSPTNDNHYTQFPTLALNTDNAHKISEATPHQQTFKVLVIGQSRVGKTSIIRRLIKDKFSASYKMTLGSVQWDFKCEVPVNLFEEVTPDKNLMRTMTSFLDQVNEENGTNIIMPSSLDNLHAQSVVGLGMVTDKDPFDDDDQNAEFGDPLSNAYGGGGDADDDYKLFNMDQQPNAHKSDHDNLTITAGLFDFQSGSTAKHDSHKSVTDYGYWTEPEIEQPAKDVRKLTMKLQITLDVVDIGFHATKDDIFDDVNAVILVIDYTNKGSISTAIDKYEQFIKNAAYGKHKNKKKRRRSRSGSGATPYQSTEPREYIPIVVAANKCDKKAKVFHKKEIHKAIQKRLLPIVQQYFPPPPADYSSNNETQSLAFEDTSATARNGPSHAKDKRMANSTLLQIPNLSFIYDEKDSEEDRASDTETDASDNDTDDENNNASSSSSDSNRKRIKNNKTSSDLLTVRRIYEQQQQQLQQNGDSDKHKKRKKKSSKKKREQEAKKNDIRYIDVISCSAKQNKNIEKLFATCIRKTLPTKLTKSVAHKRTTTTAHVTAPIWLRQVVSEFQSHTPQGSEDVMFGDDAVNDNFGFLDE